MVDAGRVILKLLHLTANLFVAGTDFVTITTLLKGMDSLGVTRPCRPECPFSFLLESGDDFLRV